MPRDGQRGQRKRDDDQLAREFLSDQARRGALVLFVGAGVSRDAGLPDWKKLVEPLGLDLGLLQSDVDGADLLDVAQWYADEKGRRALLRDVQQRLSGLSPGQMHRTLARLAGTVLFTTNFDRLMETAIDEHQGVPPDIIIEDSDVALIEEGERVTLVKLHGCLSLPDTIVLTRDDYEGYEDRHRLLISYLRSLLATRTFLFVGFSLVDPNFRLIYREIAQVPQAKRKTAYVLKVADGELDHFSRNWRRKGIKLLLFPTFTEQAAFLSKLADAARPGKMARSASEILSQGPGRTLNATEVALHVNELKRSFVRLIEDATHAGLLPGEDAQPPDLVDNILNYRGMSTQEGV